MAARANGFAWNSQGLGVQEGVVSTIASFCAVSATLTAAICTYAQVFGRVMHLVDEPDGVRKLHGRATPLVGGLAILLPSFAVSFFYLIEKHDVAFMPIAVVASALMLVVGVVDDRFDVSPLWRLASFLLITWGAFAARPLFVLHALHFDLPGFELNVALGVLAVPITTVTVIGFINAANMADGMNGQLMGSLAIWCLFIARHLGIESGIPFLTVTASAAAALCFNLRGKLFSGSSGSYAASFLVALGAIAAYRQSEGSMPAQLPVFWFWLPVLDCLRVMTGRMLEGHSPFSGDRNHFHHILLETLRPSLALGGYLGLLALPGIVAEFDLSLGGATLIVCMFVYAALILSRQLRLTRDAGAEAGQKPAFAQSNSAPQP